MPTLVYSYGAQPPTLGKELLSEQLYLGHRYYNKLIELERKRRVGVREAQAAFSSELAEAEAGAARLEVQLEGVRGAVKNRRKQARKGSPATAAEKEMITWTVTQLKTLRARIKEIRATIKHDPRIKARYAELNEEQREAIKAARKACGVHWGTYLQIEEAAERAAKTCKTVEGPTFRRYDQQGRVAVQLQGMHDDEWLPQVDEALFVLGSTEKGRKEDPVACEALAGMAAPQKLPAEDRILWGQIAVAWKASRDAKKRMSFKVIADAMGIKEDALREAWKRLGLPPRPVAGLSIDDLFSCEDQRLQVEVVSQEEWRRRTGRVHKQATPADPGSARQQRRQVAFVRLRGGSDGRKPKFIELPVVLHRPLPKGAMIKGAWILQRRIGADLRYQVQFIIETPEGLPVASAPPGTAVAINLGWRQEAGLRCGYWVDSTGAHGALTLPESILGRLKKSEELRSVRDKNFDLIKLALKQWLAAWQDANSQAPRELPAWMVEKGIESLHQWRSQARLAALLRAWSPSGVARAHEEQKRFPELPSADAPKLVEENRLLGDEDILEHLIAWLAQDLHLLAWEAHGRDNALGHRKALFRDWAAQFSQRYATVVVEDYDLRTLAKTPEAEEETQHAGSAVRYQARVAAPGELRLLIKQAVQKRGGTLLEADPKNITRRDHACGYLDEERPTKLLHTCKGCGRTYDQDHNAAQNLLAQVSS